jgi:hypothetical protein
MRAIQFAAMVVVGLAGTLGPNDVRAEQPYDDAAWREPDFARRHATPYARSEDRRYGGGHYGSFAGGRGSFGGRHGGQHVGTRRTPRGTYNDSWFQRPYPYHLDYYRMRYGGSYEPYFGNLYGPPINVFPDRGFYGGQFYY